MFEHVAIGLLTIIVGWLIYQLGKHQRQTIDHLREQVKELQDRNERLRDASQARMNYESLDLLDDGTSAVAVAMLRRAELEKLETAAHEARLKRLRELDELLTESVESFREARNPSKKGTKSPTR